MAFSVFLMLSTVAFGIHLRDQGVATSISLASDEAGCKKSMFSSKRSCKFCTTATSCMNNVGCDIHGNWDENSHNCLGYTRYTDFASRMKSERDRTELYESLKSQFSAEPLGFWSDVEKLKSGSKTSTGKSALDIYNEYIADNAPSEMNFILFSNGNELKEQIVESVQQKTHIDFTKLQERVYSYLQNQSYP
eukprot:GEMP01062465.1.p1 GENE.GEMP01062465.1~~GEMP01062465.1.p1  ORF type:complete len:192 (+),score=14.82 GEMP01062465.1:115-690(+)